MAGMNSVTGTALGGLAHLRQSVADILTTPVGARVMRREYGSRLPRLVDRPVNASTILEVYAATAEALSRWEPRLRVTRVRVSQVAAGRLELWVEGLYRPEGRAVILDGIVVGA